MIKSLRDSARQRLDRISQKRLQDIEFIDGPGKPDVNRKELPWLYRLLSGRSATGKVAGIFIDFVSSMLPRWADRLLGVVRVKTKNKIEDHVMAKKKKTIKFREDPLGYSLKRLKEQSTWKGIISTIAGLGIISISPELAEAIGQGMPEIVGGMLAGYGIIDAVRDEIKGDD